MQMNLDFVKYAKVAEKGVSKLLVRAGEIVQNKPKLLKGVNFAQSKITGLSEDVVTFLTKAQKPDGFITKAQKFIENNYTTLATHLKTFKNKYFTPTPKTANT